MRSAASPTATAGSTTHDRRRRCKRVAFKATADRMLTLGELCDLVAGRVPLVIEIKSRFDGDTPARARASATVLAGYRGPGRRDVVRSGADRRAARASRPSCRAASSRMRRDAAIARHRGVAAARYSGRLLAARPHFLAYRVQDLTTAPPLLARKLAAPAAADLDRAHARGSRARRPLCRPDDLRGLSAIIARLGQTHAPCRTPRIPDRPAPPRHSGHRRGRRRRLGCLRQSGVPASVQCNSEA